MYEYENVDERFEGCVNRRRKRSRMRLKTKDRAKKKRGWRNVLLFSAFRDIAGQFSHPFDPMN